MALAVLARQHGLITTAQLQTAGVAVSTRRRLVGAGALVEAHKWVYRSIAHPVTLLQRCVALCLAHPRGYVTGPTAGTLDGLRRMPNAAALHFALPHGARIDRIPGVTLRQTTHIGPFDVEHRPDGLRIARAPRLAFDLAADLDDRSHRSVVDQLLHERRCTVDELSAIGERLGHPARPGSMRFHRTLAVRSGPPVESHPELRVAEALLGRGVPIVVQTTWLTLPDGSRARLDMSVPELRWGVEVDVHPDHLGIEGTTSDKRRDRRCHLIGWVVERVTSLDLLDLDAVADELAALYGVRRRAMAS
jgi:hypothetical protein